LAFPLVRFFAMGDLRGLQDLVLYKCNNNHHNGDAMKTTTTTTTTTTAKLTRAQVTALRAALAAHGGYAERADAGIDACRSPAYHRARAAHEVECKARRDLGQGTDDLTPPRAERVPGATALRAWLLAEMKRIDPVRTARANARYAEPSPGIMRRLENRTRLAVGKAYDQCTYRRSESRWAGGEHTVDISCWREVTGVFASGTTSRMWSANGKWSGTCSARGIGVGDTWIFRVVNRGLAVIDGRLTLSARPIEERPGEEMYQIRYAGQGRGFALHVARAVAYRRRDGSWGVAWSLAAARRSASSQSTIAYTRTATAGGAL